MNNSDLLNTVQSTAYWTSGIFNSWMEGRGARAFRNCSIKSVAGKFRSKSEALQAAETVIKNRSMDSVRWDTAKPTASFHIPHEAIQRLGDLIDAMNVISP